MRVTATRTLSFNPARCTFLVDACYIALRENRRRLDGYDTSHIKMYIWTATCCIMMKKNVHGCNILKVTGKPCIGTHKEEFPPPAITTTIAHPLSLTDQGGSFNILFRIPFSIVLTGQDHRRATVSWAIKLSEIFQAPPRHLLILRVIA